MNQAFYTATAGAIQQQHRIDVTANNLANANTTGFKTKEPGFADLMYRRWYGPEQTPLPIGSGNYMISATTNFKAGALAPHDGAQHYAINGRGFFAVQDIISGDISYTRSGNFHWASLMENGEQVFYLADQNSQIVLDQNGQRIMLNQANPDEYHADDPQNIGIFDFQNYDGMLNRGSGYFVPVAKNGQPFAGDGELMHKMAETSNEDAGKDFARLVETQRSYSYMLKMITTQDEIATTINGLRG